MFYLTMIDKQTIFISGYEGNMYKTTDGGIIWKNYDFGSEYLKKIIMLNSQNGVIIENPTTIFMTFNGWESYNTFKFDSMFTAYSPKSLTISDLAMPSENVIIGIAQRVPNVVIFKSIDKGVNWTIRKGPDSCNRFFFLNEKLGWAIGGKVGAGLIGYQQKSFIYITLDGGETWDLIFDSLFYKDCIGFLFNINFKNSNEGIAVGSTGTILLTFDG